MPEICRFLGIVIYMLYDDHRPPHFHAQYGEYRITVDINSGVVEGRFPRRALNAVLEWYSINRDGLLENWELPRAPRAAREEYLPWSRAMLYVTAARYESGHKIWVEFSDGRSGVVDLEDDLWGPVFEPLRDREAFKRFTVSEEFHTIVWDNGADMAPEHLHAKLSDKSPHRAGTRGAQAGG